MQNKSAKRLFLRRSGAVATIGEPKIRAGAEVGTVSSGWLAKTDTC